MQITVRLWAKGGPSSERRTEETIGSANQAEQLFSFVEFRSLIQTMERLSAKAAPFSEQQTGEIAGSLNRVGPGIHYSVFPLSMRIREQPWAERAESAEKAPFPEQPMVATRGGTKQTRERCVFSKFRLPMPIPEPLSAMDA